MGDRGGRVANSGGEKRLWMDGGEKGEVVLEEIEVGERQ